MMKNWNHVNKYRLVKISPLFVALSCLVIDPVRSFSQVSRNSCGRKNTPWTNPSSLLTSRTVAENPFCTKLLSNKNNNNNNNDESFGNVQLISSIRESIDVLTKDFPKVGISEKQNTDLSNISLESQREDDGVEYEEESSFQILALCWFVAALSALDRVAMSVAILPLSSEYHFTETIKGEISSVFSLGYGLGIIPFGLIVAAFSPSVIMGVGVALWSIATIGTPIAASMTNLIEMPMNTFLVENIAPLLLIRAIMGASESVVLPATQRILANWIPLEKKSSAIATIYSGFQVGTVCAYLLSPFIMDSFGGWRGMFYLYGVIGLLWLIPWTLLASDYPMSTLQNNIVLSSNAITEETVSKGTVNVKIQKFTNDNQIVDNVDTSQSWEEAVDVIKSAPWKDLIQSKGVWAMIIAHAASNWGLYNSLSWTPTFYAEHYGLNVKESAFLSVLPSVVGAAGGLLAGRLADSIIKNIDDDESREKRTNIRKLFQGIALLGPAACLVTLGSNIPDQPITAQALLTGVVGLQAFNAAGFGAATQEKADKWSGLLYSITSLPGVMFGSFGVYVTGQILDVTGHDWSWIFYLNAIVNVIGALAFINFYDSKREFE